MPVNIAQVRVKVANRELLTHEELEALVDAEGWLMGRSRIRTVNGFMILFGQPVPGDPSHEFTPHIEVTNGRIRVAAMGFDREIYAEAAQLAALMWGAGGTVWVTGNWRLRAACREAGLTVINNNPSAKAWRAITMRRAPRPRHPAAAAPHPAWPHAQPI
jgi:hypothetical protein